MTASSICVDEACRLRLVSAVAGATAAAAGCDAGAASGCGEGAASAAASLSLLAAPAVEESSQRDDGLRGRKFGTRIRNRWGHVRLGLKRRRRFDLRGCRRRRCIRLCRCGLCCLAALCAHIPALALGGAIEAVVPVAAGGGHTLRAGQAIVRRFGICSPGVGRFCVGWIGAVLGDGGEIGARQHAGNERGYEFC